MKHKIIASVLSVFIAFSVLPVKVNAESRVEETVDVFEDAFVLASVKNAGAGVSINIEREAGDEAGVLNNDVVTGTYGDLTYEISDGEVTITGCDKEVVSIVIPERIEGFPVTCIAPSAFYYCTQMQNIEIPNGVERIGYYSFMGCSGLSGITIPESVKTIEYYSFSHCAGLKSITIPMGVEFIGSGTFFDCPELTEINVSENSSTYSSIDGVLFSKDQQTIHTFPGGKKGEYTIPNTVTKINSSAFRDCPGLTGVTIPNSVISIENLAFSGCTGLTSVRVPDSVTTIEFSVFRDCVSLRTATISNSITYIASELFLNCNSLESITIPESVTEIGMLAFADCSSLKEITIPKNVRSIDDKPFSGCLELTAISVSEESSYFSSSNGVLYSKNKTTLIACPAKKIGVYEIPDSVTVIRESAFSYCSSLKSIIIPDSVVKIESGVFWNCTGLTEIVIPNSVTELARYAFCGCSNLETVTLSEKMTMISERLFSSCTNLRIINIPDEITKLESGAFSETGIYKIIIPRKVTSIDYDAFSMCNNLETVYFKGNAPSIHDYAFHRCNLNAYYPVNDSTWTNDRFQNYGAEKITWKTWDPETGDIIDDPTIDDKPLIKNGSFTYDSCFTHEAAKFGYSYNEKWFEKNADIFDLNLAKMSICTAMSAAHVNENYITSLYRDLQFPEERIISDYPAPTSSSIGYSIASKNIAGFKGENYTLLVCAVRGGGYETEWVDNFNVGTSGNHKGFDAQGIKVFNAVKEYIEENTEAYHIDTNHLKIWITGYSRAAATANIAAHYLSQTYGNLNVFAYCFETPQGYLKKTSDKPDTNIFNLVNKLDLVPYLALEKWGFGRYGITYYYPSAMSTADYNEDKRAMAVEYGFIYGQATSTQAVFYVAKEGKKQAPFLIDVTNTLGEKISRVKAEDGFLPAVRKILEPIYSGKVKLPEKIGDAPLEITIKDDFGILFSLEIRVEAKKDEKGNAKTTLTKCDLTYGMFDFSFADTSILSLIPKAASLYTLIKMDNLSDKLGFDYSSRDSSYWYSVNGEEHYLCDGNVFMDIVNLVADSFLSKLTSNYFSKNETTDFFGHIFDSHYPELSLAWMNTVTNASQLSGSTIYRKLFVNCPVDVNVYDSDNRLVASILNEEPQDIEDSYIASYVDPDGQKVFILPGDETYRIEATAREDCDVTYTVSEMDLETDEPVKVVAYTNVPMETGETITGQAESIETETAEYPLVDNGEEITPDDVQDDEQIQYHTVEVLSDGLGIIKGGGQYLNNTYASLTAEPMTDYTFAGWYINDALVSTEESYRFMVSEDVSITAKFEATGIPMTKLTCSEEEISILIGDTFTLVPTKLPENTTNTEEIKWYSSDETIAIVSDNGVVTGISDGTAYIIATCSYFRTICEVKVEDKINAFVRRLYRLCFSREPDPEGLNTWTTLLRNKTIPASQAVVGFFMSKEMNELQLSASDFVERCYMVMMDRASDEGGKKTWTDRLDAGMSEMYILSGFVGSGEFQAICADTGIEVGTIKPTESRDKNFGITAFVSRCYSEVLERKAEAEGLNSWCDYIFKDRSIKANAIWVASNGFFHSPEYLGKHSSNAEYVHTLYRTFFGRDEDEGGYKTWMGELAKGKSRDYVMSGFSNSKEFAEIMKSYGIK